MTLPVALLAEAGPDIGTGHFVETLMLASACRASGLEPLVVATSEVPEGLLGRVQGERWTVRDFGLEPLRALADGLVRRGVRLAVTNLRSIVNEQVAVLAGAGLRVVCVDEWGGRRLDCEAVINPTVVTDHHRYVSDRPGFRMYAGPRYLSLSPECGRWHQQARRYEGGIRSTVVSMGGVDRTGATLRIVEALGALQGGFETAILLGAGFPWREQLDRLVSSVPGRWCVHQNLADPVPLFASADAAFTAGGNTLYELACVGTPAIVLFEDPHEGEQGRACEAQGFGLCLCRGIEATAEAVRWALDKLEDPALRRLQGDTGKQLVDGEGASRIVEIIKAQVSNDSAVSV